jgi:programmed cell death 6-interacting protein
MSALSDTGELGRPLFTKLVPYAVHVAASIYEDRRDRLVNNSIIDELEAMTSKIRDVLKSLNLPGSLQALEKPLGLPPGLISHAEEIRQQDGPNRLSKSIAETEKLKANDRNIYNEGVELLRSEAAEDERARVKYGTERWSRPRAKDANPKLHAQIAEIDGYLNAAATSDETVYKKLRDTEDLIRLLAGTDRELEHYVPSSRRAVLTPAVEQASSKLRACLNDINRLESRRTRKIEALKAKITNDDINPDLLKETARLEREFPMQKIEAAQFEDFFERRLLATYSSDQSLLADEESQQSQLIKKLQDTNAVFSQARRGDDSTKQREKALQSLENAFYKYKEIIQNLEAGRKFYNDLARIVGRFRDEAKQFAYSRRGEAGEIERYVPLISFPGSFHPNSYLSFPRVFKPETHVVNRDIQQSSALPVPMPNISNLSIQPKPNTRASSLQQQKDAEVYSAPAPIEEPLAAPQPQRTPVVPSPAGMWTPDMGIKFAGPPGAGGASGSSGKESSDGTVKGKKGWDPGMGVRFG